MDSITSQRPRVFVCYRREDSRWQANLLAEAIAGRFGHDAVFMDLDIRPGSWHHQIDRSLADSVAVIVVIGPRWLAEFDNRQPSDDQVRYEIAKALKLGKTLITVTVDRAQIPARASLPAEIAPLTDAQGYELGVDVMWRPTVGKLLDDLSTLLENHPPASPPEADSLYRTTEQAPEGGLYPDDDEAAQSTVEASGDAMSAPTIGQKTGDSRDTAALVSATYGSEDPAESPLDPNRLTRDLYPGTDENAQNTDDFSQTSPQAPSDSIYRPTVLGQAPPQSPETPESRAPSRKPEQPFTPCSDHGYHDQARTQSQAFQTWRRPRVWLPLLIAIGVIGGLTKGLLVLTNEGSSSISGGTSSDTDPPVSDVPEDLASLLSNDLVCTTSRPQEENRLHAFRFNCEIKDDPKRSIDILRYGSEEDASTAFNALTGGASPSISCQTPGGREIYNDGALSGDFVCLKTVFVWTAPPRQAVVFCSPEGNESYAQALQACTDIRKRMWAN